MLELAAAAGEIDLSIVFTRSKPEICDNIGQTTSPILIIKGFAAKTHILPRD